MRAMVKIFRLIFVLCALHPLGCYGDQWPNLPITISTPGVNASSQQIAVDPHGNVVAVWIENGLVQSNSATVTGGWTSNITTISGSVASTPQVAIDLNGKATAVWVENGTIKASQQVLNGNWSTSVVISGSGASTPQLAVDQSGNLVSVWVEGGIIKSNTCLVGGSWAGSPDTLSLSGAFAPQVAIGGNGVVIAVWQAQGSTTGAICSVSKMLGGTWTSPAVISATNVNSSYPQIAVDASGNAVCAWFSYQLTGSVYSNVVVQSSSQPSGGSWSSPVNISKAGVRNPADLALCVGIGPNDTAIAAWTTSYDGSFFNCEWCVCSGESWSTSYTMVSQNLLTYAIDMATVPKGDAFLVWMNYAPSSSSLSIQGAVNDLSAISRIFFNPSTLSNSNSNAYPVVALSSLDPNLYLVSAWVSFNSTNNVIQAVITGFTFTQPPVNLSVTPEINNFGVLSEIYNVLNWEPSPSAEVVNYLIYRDGICLGCVNANTFTFSDQNRTVGETVTYGVISTDSQGCQSAPITLTFTN